MKSVSANFVCALILSTAALAAEAPSEVTSPKDIVPESTKSSENREDLSIEERVQQQEQQIQILQKRLMQLESSNMNASASGMAETNATVAKKSPILDYETQNLGEVNENTEVLSGTALKSDSFPGSWPMFGSDARMKIGGYFKADFVADFDGTTDPYQFLMSTIPVKGSPEYGNEGYTSFFAKETRINIDVRRNEPGHPVIRGFVEGDFFDAEDQFRLRHAYINVGDFLIGQTWTTLSFLESLPYMIDFAAGDALFGGRTTQIRYTRSINNEWTVAVAMEQLSFLGIENPNGLPGKATRQMPLLAARSDYRWSSGVLFLGTSIAELHWDGGETGPSDSAFQYDFVVAGRQAVGPAYFTWNFGYGEGAGENIMAFAGSHANAVLNADGKLETIPAFSAVVGGGYKWNMEWSSNLSYAYGWLDTPDSRDPYALKRGGIGHVNLVWNPYKPFSTGVEFMWGTQRAQNDALGSATRLQYMAKLDF